MEVDWQIKKQREEREREREREKRERDHVRQRVPQLSALPKVSDLEEGWMYLSLIRYNPCLNRGQSDETFPSMDLAPADLLSNRQQNSTNLAYDYSKPINELLTGGMCLCRGGVVGEPSK